MYYSMKFPIYALLLASALTVSCGRKTAQEAQPVGAVPASTTTSPTLSTRRDAGTSSGNNLTSTSSSIGTESGNVPTAAASYRPLEIPSGTPVSVRLQSSISSAIAQPGDHFHAVIDSPLRVGGQIVAPSGADVTGKVVAARHSGRLEHPGMLQLELSSVRVGGRVIAISTSRVTARGASHKTRNLSWIAGGAGGGALLGGLMGGGKGALIGSVAGAGAGTATAAATGKHDIAFNVEHQLTFRLRQPAEVQ
jgi:hypothetical protein